MCVHSADICFRNSGCAGARCSLFAALAEETASVRGRYFENCIERVRIGHTTFFSNRRCHH
jgi:hypothetical protein